MFLIFVILIQYVSSNQSYKEHLLLKFLPDGNVLAHFEHRITWNMSPLDIADNIDVKRKFDDIV